MGNLRSSYRSPGWGGAVATRPVHPECPDASSGCIEGPAQFSVWGGAHTSIGDRVARPLKSEHLLSCSDSTSVLLCSRGNGLSPHPHPLSAGPARNAARRFTPRCADSDRANPEQSVPSTGQVCRTPDTNCTEWHGMAQFSAKKTAGGLSALSRPSASSSPTGCGVGQGRTQSQRRK